MQPRTYSDICDTAYPPINSSVKQAVLENPHLWLNRYKRSIVRKYNDMEIDCYLFPGSIGSVFCLGFGITALASRHPLLFGILAFVSLVIGFLIAFGKSSDLKRKREQDLLNVTSLFTTEFANMHHLIGGVEFYAFVADYLNPEPDNDEDETDETDHKDGGVF